MPQTLEPEIRPVVLASGLQEHYDSACKVGRVATNMVQISCCQGKRLWEVHPTQESTWHPQHSGSCNSARDCQLGTVGETGRELCYRDCVEVLHTFGEEFSFYAYFYALFRVSHICLWHIRVCLLTDAHACAGECVYKGKFVSQGGG
jgi:hypothetical protein